MQVLPWTRRSLRRPPCSEGQLRPLGDPLWLPLPLHQLSKIIENYSDQKHNLQPEKSKKDFEKILRPVKSLQPAQGFYDTKCD